MCGVSKIVRHALTRDVHVAVVLLANLDKHIAIDPVLVPEEPIDKLRDDNADFPCLYKIANGFQSRAAVNRPGS